jgi:hypothetical protein
MRDAGNLLDRIRECPGIYIGTGRLTALYNTIIGYELALYEYGKLNETTFVLSHKFHDWVAYRLHYTSTTRGWRDMILESCNQDEDAAFERFFELLDEHANRKPKVVARASGIQKKYRQQREGQEETIERYPTSVSLVTYTDDPGFFVLSDEPGYSVPFFETGFCRELTQIERDIGIHRSKMEVFEPEIFERLLREDSER